MSVACCAVQAGVPDPEFADEWQSPDPSDTDEDEFLGDAPWEQYDDSEQEESVIKDYGDEDW